MSFEKTHDIAERGLPQKVAPTPLEYMSPAEKLMLFRDVAFACIILLHLGTTLFAIPALATHTAAPDSRPYLAVIIFVGVLVPILGAIGYRDQIRTSKITSAIWFEFGWCSVIMVIDFIVAVGQSSLKDTAKTSVALTWLQTITMMVYTFGLAFMVLLQHKRFPEVSIWQSSPQSVQWLRSPHVVDFNIPPSPSFFVSPTPKGIIPAWHVDYPDMHEVKLGPEKKEPKTNFGTDATFIPQSTLSPNTGYVNAHPFWQERVQRHATVEDDMTYIIQRYGLNVEADKLAKTSRPSGHGKHGRKLSIRDLEISRPVPVASTVRRANTLAPSALASHARQGHQRVQVRATPSLSIDIPHSTLDVPVDVVPPEPAATRAIHINSTTRSLGLAGRTLIGTSRPPKKQAISSKPLPSPPAIDDSDESLRSQLSAGGVSGSHSFVMGLAQKVQISASKVRPLMISTPKATEHPIDRGKDDSDDDKEDIAL